MVNELREASWSAPALWRFGRARRRKRQPGRARSPAMSQLVAVRQHRPMAVWGGRTGQRAFESVNQNHTCTVIKLIAYTETPVVQASFTTLISASRLDLSSTALIINARDPA